jgi:diguanylate cyclase (GGDEF)-like protein
VRLVQKTKALQLLLLLLLTVATLCAQEYNFRTYGPADGLTNLGIRQIYQDRTGFLWVITDNGIFRYDGDRLEAFGSGPGTRPFSGSAIGEAPDGTLLVGGETGLYRLNGNHFEAVKTLFHSVSWMQGIQADGQGHTLLGTDLGLVELSSIPGKADYALRNVPRVPGTSGPGVSAILVDGKTLWYGCGSELCRKEDGDVQVYGRANGLPAKVLMSIRKDREGDLWVRAEDGSVLVLPHNQSRFHSPHLPIPGKDMIGPLASTSDGAILIPYSAGLLVQDEKGWHKIDRLSGLRGVVFTAFEDRQHSIWVGLSGRGLVQWRGSQEWQNYTSESGLASDYVYEILPEQDGPVWVGSRTGLMRGERKPSGMRWKSVRGLSGFSVHSLQDGPDRGLWVGTENHGVARMNTRTGRVKFFQKKAGFKAKSARLLRFDKNGWLWAATDAGLFVSKPPYAHFERIGTLPAFVFWSLAIGNDGSVWTGSADNLFHLAEGKWAHYGPGDGLNGADIETLCAGNGNEMWIGYLSGKMDRFHLQGSKLQVVSGVQPPNSHNLVYFLNRDTTGRLWVGTDQGVDVQDGTHWRHYDVRDGLVWDDTNMNSFAAEPDGTIWIGTSGGLSRFSPRPHSEAAIPPIVVFTHLILGKTDVTGQRDPSASNHANSLYARYSALNALQGSGVRFRYRLEGGESAWTETTQRELHFAKLAAGAYELEIEVQDADGVWSQPPVVFSFHILTPWYRTWWFLGVCGLLPVLIATAVIRWRVARVEKREREVQELVDAHQVINNLAFYDPLTSLPNRRLLLDRLQQSLTASARSGSLRGLLFIDLDNFKSLNDTLGHPAGDMVLQETARRLTGTVRKSDTAARLGGDEFVVILEDMGAIPEAAANEVELVAEKILDAIGKPYMLVGRACLSSASIGITIFGAQGETANEILQQADIALYQAKSVGRNSVRFFAPALQAAVNARAALEEDLRTAIKDEQFALFYQPQITGGQLTGAEALIRWNHPERGILSPMEFIAVAEETGLILPIGDWVLRSACRQIAAWTSNKETESLSVAANISARQFRQPDFVKQVLAAIEETGANPNLLKLELTESTFVDNFEDVIAKMTELKTHGLRFSLDDFGTGYSSLSYLKRLPLDELKIDRAFVRDILKDVSSRAIAQTVISLSQALGLTVIAEGVETEEQRMFLDHLGCSAYQGFLFSKPVTIDEFDALMTRVVN